MSRVIRSVVQIGASIIGATIGFAIGGPTGALIGATLFSFGARALLGSGGGGPRRAAAAATLQLGEQPRQAVLGRSAVSGSLVDAFNYGGRYGTDWEVLVIALADHRCDALEGFFVDDKYVAFAADGNVAGFNNQLQVFWRSGTWTQSPPSILTTNGPGWTANDRGRGVAYVVVAYKADASDASNPVWPSGRPRFRWVVRGLRCYQARKDSTVGGSGAHRRSDPATWQWTENPIDIRYNWVRGIYAGDLVAQPEMLLIGRGLSAIEAPPANVFARANLCDELVGGAARYRIGGVVAATEPFIDVESDFAAAVAGTISQPEGAVEVNPGEAKAPVATFTDDDLIVGSEVIFSDFLGAGDDNWINTVVARYVDPAQRWNQHSAPVRRDIADVTADGGPREAQLGLDFVTNGPQAQRVAEIARRFGRLWGRAQLTLPPRFAFIEEGDWVTWQSQRHLGGATFTFRVEAWGSGRDWHHQLTLRQISASVYSDTAPLTDGSVASDQPAPPAIAAPGAAAWSVAAVLIDGTVRVPALRLSGAADDPAARFVIAEIVQQVAAPDVNTVWTFAASLQPDVTLFDIPVVSGGTFWVAISYEVDGVIGPRRVLGPVVAGALTYPDGTPVAPVAPANANRVPFSRMEGNQGWAVLFNPVPIALTLTYGATNTMRSFRAAGTAAAAGNSFSVGTGSTPAFPLSPGQRVSVQSRIERIGAAGGTWQLELWMFAADGVTQDSVVVASGNTSRLLTDPPAQGFVDVPTNRFSGRLELRWIGAAAGAIELALAEPMVASAAIGQTVHPTFSPGPNAENGADVTATAQRSIEPQFPVIEIKQGEAGHTGNRTVTHTAKRGTATLTGGTWSLPSENLGTGDATINSGTGTVALSGIVQSGAYSVRYTHTDGLATDLPVNVTYVPTPPGGVVSAKTARQTSSAGTANNNLWQNILTLAMTSAPTGRVSFGGFEGLSFLEPLTGTGTADFEARLQLDGVTLTSVLSQNVVTGGVISAVEFSEMFSGSYAVTSGNRSFTIDLRRTSGTGQISSTNTALEATIIAT
jgi:hypothetical protein